MTLSTIGTLLLASGLVLGSVIVAAAAERRT
jgi:hypothetical protein